MRWILIVLLMCNGIYFLWQNYLLQNDSLRQLPAASKSSEAAESLVLLSEADQLALQPVVTVAPVAESGANAKASAATTASINANANINTTTSAKASQSNVESPAAGTELAAASPQQEMCLLIGPFKEEVSGRQMVGRLSALEIAAKLQRVEIPGKPDYWVHLPPQVSRRAAIKLLRELQASGVDSFLITEGELENGISLGFFTDQARADKVYNQRVKEGYQAAIKTVPRIQTEIWALLNPDEASKFSEPLWGKISQADSKLERRKNYCDKIASTDNFD